MYNERLIDCKLYLSVCVCSTMKTERREGFVSVDLSTMGEGFVSADRQGGKGGFREGGKGGFRV